jgi:hypothetical protein
VVEPEIHHHFLELSLGEHRAGELGRLELRGDDRRPSIRRKDLADLLGVICPAWNLWTSWGRAGG